MNKNRDRVFTPQELAIISESVRQGNESTKDKLRNLNWLMAGVIIVVFVSFLTMIFMMGTLVVDSFHINSTTYTEYTKNLETQNNLLESNKKNQEILINQQKYIDKIMELLKNK